MTQPTQAQIEAAFEVASNEARWSLNKLPTVKRMLSAAAQVGEPSIDDKLEQWDEWYETLPPALKARLSISDFRRLGDNFYRIFVLQKAAAQVGEPMKEIKQYEQMISRNKVQSERDNATIERCRQVALNCELTDERHAIKVRQQIAAALRKLKDEP